MKRYKLLLILLDALLIDLAFFLALCLRVDFKIPPNFIIAFRNNMLVIPFIQIGVYMLFNIYSILWQYTSTKELFRLVIAVIIGSTGALSFGTMIGHLLPRSVYIIYLLIILIFMAGSRISIRMLYRLLKDETLSLRSLFGKEEASLKKRLMIVGAGEASSILIKELQKEFYGENDIILAVDDDRRKHHANIHGVPVRGTLPQIPELAQKWQIDKILIAIPSASKKRIAEIIKICNTTSCQLELVPPLSQTIDASFGLKNLRRVSIEDLLGREEINLDNTQLQTYIHSHTVLVTGAGGSIGSELCRQIIDLQPKKLIIFDIYENNAYDLQNELLQKGVSKELLEVIIGSVRDKDKLRYVFAKHQPELIFHAAAHKHVPLMESSPEEAIKNNVFGTLNTALLAKEYQVKKFILISTDKAVNPTNVMGASKRICEMIIQALKGSSTEFAAVRFGNVLGSNGSVIPLFKKQLEAGGPLTVTHPDIIRYFMTIPEAVRLILEALTFAKGGEIFILDMGEPIKIMDLAKNFIKLSGLELGKDIDIKITGLRPGEKLFEELLLNEEGLQTTSCDKIYIGQPMELSFEVLLEKLEVLQASLYDEETLKAAIKDLVPTYTYTPQITHHQTQVI
ncbi:nucleoside-diphosphate sugar epimerase [Sporanaerobium hydrogeniformans]|uniref:Nucleoside-diphosphate sugar epimerase n=1 Tax=Sporanaerobium hydrogeniformans TaxID=3072179 RepID=A0AC61DAB2_9FIRM|nr:nucleoside-diphosphate sugar epimerase/dehydratase [Sporanaerobium hydrogeniformans]PHV70184.1 nucleoside-diphosphate sugar epimerase [Sporanaerobium hydrogeniformans]